MKAVFMGSGIDVKEYRRYFNANASIKIIENIRIDFDTWHKIRQAFENSGIEYKYDYGHIGFIFSVNESDEIKAKEIVNDILKQYNLQNKFYKAKTTFSTIAESTPEYEVIASKDLKYIYIPYMKLKKSTNAEATR